LLCLVVSLPLVRLAGSFTLGAKRAREARWAAVGYRSLSSLTSAMIIRAAVVPTSGISSSRFTAEAKGVIVSLIAASSWVMSAIGGVDSG
jgi:hypothetical protein